MSFEYRGNEHAYEIHIILALEYSGNISILMGKIKKAEITADVHKKHFFFLATPNSGFILGSALRDHSGRLEGSYEMAGIEPMCMRKVNTLPIILSLWPHP